MNFLKISEKNINWSMFLGTLILIVLCSQLRIRGVNAGPSSVGGTTANTVIPGSFLSLISKKSAYSVGETFSVTVKVNSLGNKVDGVDSVINYDHSIISLVSVTKSSLMVFNNSGDDCAINPNFTSGKVNFTCYSSDSLNSKAVDGELVILNFVAKSLGNSKITFECTKGSTLESNIVSNNSVDIIDCARNKNLPLNVNQPSGLSTSSSNVKAKCGHTRNTCAIGTVNDAALSDTNNEYRWKCLSKNGGKNVNCALAKKNDGKCGSKKNTCVSGTLKVMSNSSTEYRWKCIGRNGGKMVSCSIKK